MTPSPRSSLARCSLAALAVLAAGACGSAATPRVSTRAESPKLSLTKSGGRAAAADSAAAMPMRLAKYVLDGTLPDLGRQALVYRWTGHAVDAATVGRLAQALGIDAAPTATPDGFTASNADATLTVSTYGGSTQISYYPGGPDGVTGSGGGSTGSSSSPSTGTGVAPDGTVTAPSADNLPDQLAPPVDVPNATDAERIARDLLDRMGVLDGDWEAEVNDSGGIAVTCAVGTDCSGEVQPVRARDVSFFLVLDGIRVDGIVWNVTVGERSRIESLYGEWGSAAVLGTYDLRSTTDAYAALQQGESLYGGGVGIEKPIAVDDTPVSAQADGATEPTDVAPVPPVDEPTLVDPVPLPPDTTDTVVPIEIHVTGVSLGLARWDAVDSGANVVDIVPVYQFHTTVDGSTSDVQQLALAPDTIDFADPIGRPVPLPAPAESQPAPAPLPPDAAKSEPAG